MATPRFDLDMPVDPNTVDTIATNADRSEVILLVAQDEPWDGSENQQDLLTLKISGYIDFVGSGELEARVKPAAGFRTKIYLYCAPVLEQSTTDFLRRVRDALNRRNIGFLVKVQALGGYEWYPL